jgi:hypothetical protein
MPVFGQQISHGGTKTSASQDRNWALFSHMQSVNPYQWRCRHYYGAARSRPAPASITDTCRKKTKKTEENAHNVTGKVFALG